MTDQVQRWKVIVVKAREREILLIGQETSHVGHGGRCQLKFSLAPLLPRMSFRHDDMPKATRPTVYIICYFIYSKATSPLIAAIRADARSSRETPSSPLSVSARSAVVRNVKASPSVIRSSVVMRSPGPSPGEFFVSVVLDGDQQEAPGARKK
jgi:hypothetical protein